MKTEIINAGLITPNPSRFTEETVRVAERKIFESKIVELLELPENWKDYLKFEGTADYISVKGNSNYKERLFRRFKRGKEATITAEMKEDIQTYITHKIEAANNSQKKEQSNLYYRNMVNPILGNYMTDEIEVYYSEGIEIRIKEPKNSGHIWSHQSELCRCRLTHSGEITEPIFPISVKYNTTITAMKRWIESNEEMKDTIIKLAQNIKADLPKEFFITE